MGECMQELQNQPECPGDEILAQQVKMQLILEKAALSRWYDSSVLETCDQDSALPSFYIHTLHAQLDAVRNAVPFHLETNSKYIL